MTATMLIVFAGILLSIIFEYTPKLEGWYERQLPQTKQLTMLLMLSLSSGLLYSFACLGWLSNLWPAATITCDKAGAETLAFAFFLAVGANQGIHDLVKKRGDRG